MISQRHSVVFAVDRVWDFTTFGPCHQVSFTSTISQLFSLSTGMALQFECSINLLLLDGSSFDWLFAPIKKTIKCDLGIFNRVKNQKRGSFGIFAQFWGHFQTLIKSSGSFPVKKFQNGLFQVIPPQFLINNLVKFIILLHSILTNYFDGLVANRIDF